MSPPIEAILGAQGGRFSDKAPYPGEPSISRNIIVIETADADDRDLIAKTRASPNEGNKVPGRLEVIGQVSLEEIPWGTSEVQPVQLYLGLDFESFPDEPTKTDRNGQIVPRPTRVCPLGAEERYGGAEFEPFSLDGPAGGRYGCAKDE